MTPFFVFVVQLSETKYNYKVELETQKKEHQDAIAKIDAKHLEEISGRLTVQP